MIWLSERCTYKTVTENMQMWCATAVQRAVRKSYVLKESSDLSVRSHLLDLVLIQLNLYKSIHSQAPRWRPLDASIKKC